MIHLFACSLATDGWMAVFKIIEECWKTWWKLAVSQQSEDTSRFSVQPESLLAHMSWTVSVHVKPRAMVTVDCDIIFTIKAKTTEHLQPNTDAHTRRQWICRCQEPWEDLNNRRKSRGRKANLARLLWLQKQWISRKRRTVESNVWGQSREMDCKLEETQCVYVHVCTDKICLHILLWQISQPFSSSLWVSHCLHIEGRMCRWTR